MALSNFFPSRKWQVERVRGALKAISTTAEINVAQLVNLAVEADFADQDSKNVPKSTTSGELVSRESILQGFFFRSFFWDRFQYEPSIISVIPFLFVLVLEQCLVVET